MKLTNPPKVPIRHGDGEAELQVDREVGQHRRGQAAKDRSLVVAESDAVARTSVGNRSDR